MNILESILSNGDAISQVARQLGISENQARDGLTQVVPALSRGIAKNSSDQGGLDALRRALETGDHGRYVDRPEILSAPESVDDGNGILGHIFGNKDVSREVATRASKQSGIGSAIIRKMLPMAASLIMATLGKRMFGNAGGGAGGMLGNVLGSLLGGGGGGKQAGGLTGFLDFDRDGSIADDLLGIALKRFF